MVTFGRNAPQKTVVSATALQNFLFLFIGLLSIGSFYTIYLVGYNMGETIVEMEGDKYNPNLLDTIKWATYPDGWEKMSFYHMRKHFKCSAHGHDQSKQLITLEEWNIFRQNWKEVVDSNVTKFDDTRVPPTKGYVHDGNGNPPPYYARQSRGKGRGLFASRPIQKGELVHDGNKNALIFPDAMAFRRYLFSLPRKLACDMEEWAWTQKVQKDGPYRIVVALDISTLMNSGGSMEIVNVMPKESTSLQLFATRDIKKDKEILMKYSVYPVS